MQTAVLEVYQPALFPSCGPNSATPLRCTSRSVSPPAWRRHGQESGQQLPTRPPAPLARAGADPVAELLTAAALPPVVHEQVRRSRDLRARIMESAQTFPGVHTRLVILL